MRHLALLCLSLSLAACGAELPTGATGAAITGGAAYDGHPAVGRLRIGTAGLCTATLVGKRTVLTAAHCIVGDSFTFVLDSGEELEVAATHRHFSYVGEGDDHDIAVVLLEQQPTDVEPVVVATSAPAVNQPITLVGYGVTMCQVDGSGQLHCTDDADVKRRAENTIASVSAIEFDFQGSGSTCKGDSGGPAFSTVNGTEVQIGVTSRGQMPCGTRAIDTRVDAFVPWISEVSGGDLRTEANPPTVRITSPGAGQLDSGAVSVTADVADDSGTVVSVALVVDGQPVATLEEGPFTFDIQLTDGSHTLGIVAEDPSGNRGEATVTVEVGEQLEPPVEPPPGTFGAPCHDGDDCQSGLCAVDAASDEEGYCTEACGVQLPLCPGESSCLPTSDPARQVCGRPEPQNKMLPRVPFLVGGCNVASDGAARGPWPLLVLIALWVLARRRAA